MARTITIRISGRATGTDAPTADDLLDQVRDYLEILLGVESALAEDGRNAIAWRVVNATKVNPIGFEMQPFPVQYGVSIDRRSDIVVRQAAEGLSALQRVPERPLYFSDKVLGRAERIFERVTNGLSLSEIDFGEGITPISITPTTARGAAKNAKLALQPIGKPYREIGSVEGYYKGVEKDGFGRRLLFIRSRLTGDDIKCILRGAALSKIEENRIADVYANTRIVVLGTINFRAPGKISQVDANDILFPPGRGDLPSIDDILDPEFTSGLRTEEYLERLRDGRLS